MSLMAAYWHSFIQESMPHSRQLPLRAAHQIGCGHLGGKLDQCWSCLACVAFAKSAEMMVCSRLGQCLFGDASIHAILGGWS